MKQWQLYSWDILANCTAFDNGQEVTWLFWLWQLGELQCKLFKSHHCEGYFFQHLLLHFWAVTSCTLPCWLWDSTLNSYKTGLGVVVWCTRKHSQVHAVHLSSLWKSSSRNLTFRKFSLQLTSSALKKEKRYKYSYNLIYPSPFLTIDLILVSYGQ